MKNITVLLGLTLLLSCSRTPEAISDANDFIENGKYEKAFIALNKMEDDADEWQDSAKVLKHLSFEKLLLTNEWDRIDAFLQDEVSTKKDKRECAIVVKNLVKKLMDIGAMDSVISIFGQKAPILSLSLDTAVLAQTAELVLAKVLPGTWQTTTYYGPGYLEFEKTNDGYDGKCANDVYGTVGWYKGSMVHKIGKCKGGLIFEAQTSYHRGDYEYLKSGFELKIINSDSIAVSNDSYSRVHGGIPITTPKKEND